MPILYYLGVALSKSGIKEQQTEPLYEI